MFNKAGQAIVLSTLTFLMFVSAGVGGEKPTDFDRYVSKPDKAFSFKVVSTQRDAQTTTYVVDLKSQKWLTDKEVDRTLWQHWLVITRPNKTTADTAMLYIGGGRNGREAPKTGRRETRQIAVATNSVVIELGTIPNQPLVFHEDGKPRFEDDLIAYGWDQFLKTGNTLWLARFPMVKSVIRAMDASQAVLAAADEPLKVKKFVVAGGSKRGWTTWMTAAADKRVCAIAPIVIDVLNAKISMDHHFKAYGFWAPAIGDYVRHKITHRRNHPRYKTLLKEVDPYSYRHRFQMPKCIINATGDEFFLPDSSQFYFDDLPAEKHLCYVPNSNHSLRGTDALETLASFHFCIVNNVDRPKYSWQFEGKDTIVVTPTTQPKQVLLWQATNAESRDFRVDIIGRGYKSTKLEPDGKGKFHAVVHKPPKGWTAFFVQLVYDVKAPVNMRLTTPVRVIPDTLPFENKVAPLLPAAK